jgi:uncharacterized protein (TIGR03083 family)
MEYRDTIAKLYATWDSIAELCAPLSESQWKTATLCPGWSVQDNLSHLIGTERALAGLPTTEHRSAGGDHVKNPIGEFNEHEVDVRRDRSGAEVFNEWREIAAQRRQFLDSAPDDYFETKTMTPTGPGTMADFLHIRVLDCWAHEQDIRDALGIPGHQGGPAAEHTIDRLIRTLPIVVGKRAATPEGRGVVVQLTGPVERTIPVLVTNGRAAIVESVVDPLATLTMDSMTFVTLALGRRSAAECAWSSTGDATLAGRIASQLNMMI